MLRFVLTGSLIGAALLAGGAMAATSSRGPLVGIWSGDRATLTLTATGGSFTEDCATTTLTEAAILDQRGSFTVAAQQEAHGGGPQQADVAPAFVAVVLHGQWRAGGIALTVRAPGRPETKFRLEQGRRLKRLGCY